LLDDLGVSAIIDQQDEQEEDQEKADPAGEDKREGTDE